MHFPINPQSLTTRHAACLAYALNAADDADLAVKVMLAAVALGLPQSAEISVFEALDDLSFAVVTLELDGDPS